MFCRFEGPCDGEPGVPGWIECSCGCDRCDDHSERCEGCDACGVPDPATGEIDLEATCAKRIALGDCAIVVWARYWPGVDKREIRIYAEHAWERAVDPAFQVCRRCQTPRRITAAA